MSIFFFFLLLYYFFEQFVVGELPSMSGGGITECQLLLKKKKKKKKKKRTMSFNYINLAVTFNFIANTFSTCVVYRVCYIIDSPFVKFLFIQQQRI